MVKRCLLIAPASYDFKLDNSNTIERVPSDNKSITDILLTLKDSLAEILIVPVEQTIKDSEEVNFSGLELIKHIRLTPELGDTGKLPIICLHWHSVDYYVNIDKENIFLYSPSIYRYQYPFENIDIGDLKHLEESLNPFLFGSEKDEYISDHVFRNEIAIKQFEQQVDNPELNVLREPLWYKKTYYKNYEFDSAKSKSKIDAISLPLRILFADDMADKWTKPIKKVTQNSQVISIKSLEEFEKVFDKKIFIDNLKVTQINSISDLNRKSNDIKNYYREIFDYKFNVILLDMYFSNVSNREIEDSDGFKILTHLERNTILIPVIIFSATTKNLNNLSQQFRNIVGHFTKSYSSVKDFVEILENAILYDMLSKIAHKAICLHQYQGKYFDFSKKAMSIETQFQVRLNLISIVDKIHLIDSYLQKEVPDDKMVNKVLEEIMGLICVIQEASSTKDSYTQFQWFVQNIRDSVFHSGVSKGDYNSWKSWKLETKIKKIDEAMVSIYSSILFRLQV